MRWKPVVYPLIVIAVGAGLVSVMSAKPESSLAAAEQSLTPDPLANAPTVATIRPVRDLYAPQLQLYSQLQSRQQVEITSPVATEVLAVAVYEGDRVNKGDVLVELDTRALTRQVQQLQARRMDITARRDADTRQYESNLEALDIERQLVEIAQRSVQRVADLRKQNLNSAADLETAERTLQNQLLALQNRELAIARYELTDRQYQAQLMELDSQLAQAQDQLADATVRAPFAAQVSQVQVQVGSTPVVGQKLLTLIDPAQQELVAWVSANAVSPSQLAQPLRGSLETHTSAVPVSVSHVDPVTSSGSLRLFFKTDTPDSELAINRFYRLWLNLPTVEAYAVPEAAVYSNQYVYQVGEDALQRVAVNVVGERFQDGQLWRLVQGDLSGANVLVTRLDNATQGLAVRTADVAPTLAAAE